MADTSAGRDPLEEVAEEFLERHRRGERPPLTEYTARYPDLADAIRDLFPALVQIEQLKPGNPLAGDASDLGPAGRPPLQQLGDFRILREVGRGGMGIVYEAEQVSLGRHVAVKVLAVQALLDPRHLRRFQREACAAARLHHSNIVPVYGVGQHEGIHFYVMQFIRGLGLDEVLDELQRLRWPADAAPPAATRPRPKIVTARAAALGLLTGEFERGSLSAPNSSSGDGEEESPARLATEPPSDSGLHLVGQLGSSHLTDSGRAYWRSVARVGLQAAEALAYAAGQGILHRDVKPSNLLLDTQGTVWVTDFGLAKSTDDPDDLTNTGDVVGTLRYLAPERLQGKGDARSDVYSLGLTLYELLTLRPAYEDRDRNQLFQAILGQEAPRPRKLNPAVPRDLETVVLKATASNPARRYQTAGELAEDLRRFVEDKPIRARRVGELERLWRWGRRNPGVAGLLVSLLASLMLGLTGVAWKWRDAEAQKDQALSARFEADAARSQAIEARDASQRQSARLTFERGLTLAEQGDAGAGLHWMVESLRTAPESDEAFRVMVRRNLTAWLGRVPVLQHMLHHPKFVDQVAVSPDGKRIATACRDGKARVWDAVTGRTVGPPLEHPLPVKAVAFSPDEKVLGTGCRHSPGKPAIPAAYLWEVQSGRLLARPMPAEGRGEADYEALAFSPDGKIFLTGNRDGTVRRWDATSGRPVGDALRLPAPVSLVAFHPDGKRFLTGTDSSGKLAYQLWDGQDLRPVQRSYTAEGAIAAAALRPDGATVLTELWGLVKQLDLATGKPAGAALDHPRGVHRAAFSPDGRTVVTCCADGVCRTWDEATGEVWQAFPHTAEQLAVGFDGETVVTSGGSDATARVWRLSRPESRPAPGPRKPGRPAGVRAFPSAAISADARRIVLRDGQGTARLLDTATGQPLGPPWQPPLPRVLTVALSPDGKTAVAGCDFNVSGGSTAAAVAFWDAVTGRPLGQPLPHLNWVAALTFSPDGKTLAAGDYSSRVVLYDVARRVPLGPALAQADIVLSLAFSPNGRTLAVGTASDWSLASRVDLWDVATRQRRGDSLPHRGYVTRVAFTPDGQYLLSLDLSGATTRLWEVASGRLAHENVGHAQGTVLELAANAKTFLVGDEHGHLWVRETATGRLIGPTLSHREVVRSAAFSPDGTVVAAGCADGSTRLWDLRTFKPLGPPVVQRAAIVGVAFAPDGRSFVTAADDGDVRRWRVPEAMAGEPEVLALRLQVRTGLRLDAEQAVVPLGSEQWEAACTSLAEREGSVEAAYHTTMADQDWHEARARDAEEDGDVFGTLWHLDRLLALRPDDGLLYARRARAHAAAGRWDSADADYTRARKYLSAAQLTDEYAHRAVDAQEAGQWSVALGYLDRLVAEDLNEVAWYVRRAAVYGKLGRAAEREADLERASARGAGPAVLIDLADARAGQGRWAEVAALYRRVEEQGAVALAVILRHALAYLKAGDRQGYRRLCTAVIAQAKCRPVSEQDANTAAWICALAPEAVTDYRGPVALAEAAVSHAAGAARHGVLNTLGAILYRAGRYAEAVKRLEEGIAADQGRGLPQDYAFLAMAEYRRGNKDKARAWLDRAGPATELWEQLEVDLLREEATALLRGTSDSPN
jgi:WD40 repeat protein/serine/threonine protein kinase/tetratricopeptide (TPR) repeat protein